MIQLRFHSSNSFPILLLGLCLVLFQHSRLTAGTEEPGTILWEFETWFDWGTSPAIGPDNTVYAGELYALDGKTGEEKWEFGVDLSFLSSPAIAPNGTVYIGSMDDKLYGLTGSIGRKNWEYLAEEDVMSSPAIGADGTVYVGSEDFKLYAIYGSTGVNRWEFEADDEIDSSPAIGADGTVYFGSDDGNLYALDGADGSREWIFATGGDVESSPAIGADGTIYVGCWDGKVYAVNGTTGAKKWEFATKDRINSSAAIGVDGTVFIGSEDNSLYALDGETGALKWEFVTDDDIDSSPAIGSDGTVYIGSDDNSLYALDEETGERKWEVVLNDDIVSSPAIGPNGVIYVASGKMIYAIQGSSGPALSSWPMFGQNIRRTRSVLGHKNPNSPIISSGNSYLYDDDSDSLEVGKITAIDKDGDTLGYHIIGGDDMDLFQIERDTGAFCFKEFPDSANPADADGDNVYKFTIQVHDGISVAEKGIFVTVSLGDSYRDSMAFISRVLVDATSLDENWYSDPSYGYVYGTSETPWLYQKELGYLLPQTESEWFYSADTDLGWLYMDDAHVEAESLGSHTVMVGYIYSENTEGWLYLTSSLAADGSVVSWYYDTVTQQWNPLEK